MQVSFIERFLCCPLDRAYPLRVEAARWDAGDLVEGLLRCPTCDASYPVRAGIPHLLPPTGIQPDDVAVAKSRESRARDADAAGYDATISDYQTTMEIQSLLDGVNLKNGDTVIDLGAGTGRLTHVLAARGATILALDISPVSLELNRTKTLAMGEAAARVAHVACDACYLPIRDGSADRVVSGMLLEHIPTEDQRARCMSEIYRTLRAGGRVALTVYNYPLSKRRVAARDGFHGANLYYHRLDRAEMRQLLRGFRVRTLTAVLNLPGGRQIRWLDRWIAAIPPLASLVGDLLLVVGERPTPRAMTAH